MAARDGQLHDGLALDTAHPLVLRRKGLNQFSFLAHIFWRFATHSKPARMHGNIIISVLSGHQAAAGGCIKISPEKKNEHERERCKQSSRSMGRFMQSHICDLSV